MIWAQPGSPHCHVLSSPLNKSNGSLKTYLPLRPWRLSWTISAPSTLCKWDDGMNSYIQNHRYTREWPQWILLIVTHFLFSHVWQILVLWAISFSLITWKAATVSRFPEWIIESNPAVESYPRTPAVGLGLVMWPSLASGMLAKSGEHLGKRHGKSLSFSSRLLPT